MKKSHLKTAQKVTAKENNSSSNENYRKEEKPKSNHPNKKVPDKTAQKITALIKIFQKIIASMKNAPKKTNRMEIT